MYFPDSAKVGLPVKRHPHKIESFKQSTTGFFEPNVPFKKRYYAGTKIDYHFDFFMRCNPMPLPTMGQAYAKFNWYYVPYRTVWKGYNYFRTKTLNPDRNYNTTTPYISCDDLMAELVNGSVTFVTAGTSTDFDFMTGNSYYKFNTLGQQVYTILCQLGYNVFWKTKDNHKLNALPLLCWAKCMLDNYIPKNWQNLEYTFNEIYKCFAKTDSYKLAQADLHNILTLSVFAPFEDDYYNVGWNNPASPNYYSNDSMVGIAANDSWDNGNGESRNAVSNANTIHHSAAIENMDENYLPYITQEDLNYLKAMDKFLKKNQIAGTKYWDRMLVLYGIKPIEAKLDCAELVYSCRENVNFGVINSNSATNDAELGDYAGQGQVTNNKDHHIQYECEADGYLLCITTVTPIVGYGLGFDHDVLTIYNEEFWVETYDGCGTEAIPAIELYSGYDLDNYPNTDLFNCIWDFMPRYAWDKCDINKITGLYNLLSQKSSWEAWTFLRWMNVDSFSGSYGNELTPHINLMFNIGRNEGRAGIGVMGYDQFERIFYQEFEHNLHLYMVIKGVHSDLLKPLYDYEDIIDENDKPVNIEVNTHE